MSIDKFSWAQMTSNTDGKTSGSGFIGIIISFTGCVSFLAGVVYMFMNKLPDVMIYSSGIIAIGAGLLGWRKYNATEPGDIPELDQIKDISETGPKE